MIKIKRKKDFFSEEEIVEADDHFYIELEDGRTFSIVQERYTHDLIISSGTDTILAVPQSPNTIGITTLRKVQNKNGSL